MTTPLATEKLQQTPEIVVRRSFLGLLSGLIVTSISGGYDWALRSHPGVIESW